MRLIRLQRISELFAQFQLKSKGKESLLSMVDDAEIAERVYNSNAIENSTLTLPETEKIILQLEISRHVSLREVFEAKNLALVYGYIKKTVIVAHEYMGMPTALAAILDQTCNYKTVFYAHEVAPMRKIV